MNEKLDLFIKENRKSFPKYFKVRELRKYNKNGQLYQIYFLTSLVGFYVLEETIAHFQKKYWLTSSST